jgi:hypothetical protein
VPGGMRHTAAGFPLNTSDVKASTCNRIIGTYGQFASHSCHFSAYETSMWSAIITSVVVTNSIKKYELMTLMVAIVKSVIVALGEAIVSAIHQSIEAR